MAPTERTCRICGHACSCVVVKACSACISKTPGGDASRLPVCDCMESIGLTARGQLYAQRIRNERRDAEAAAGVDHLALRILPGGAR